MTILKWLVASVQWSPLDLVNSKSIHHDHFKVAGGQCSVVTPPGLNYSKHIYHDHFKVAGGQCSWSHPQASIIILSTYTMTVLKWPMASAQWSPSSGLDNSMSIHHDHFEVAGGQSLAVDPRP